MKDSIDFKEIGARLKQVRKHELHLTLAQMQKITGVSGGGISVMESGLKKPYSVYLYALAKEFNVNINWVLTGSGPMFEPEIDLNLDFGKDVDVVQDLIYCLGTINMARYDILGYFEGFKNRNKELLEDTFAKRKK